MKRILLINPPATVPEDFRVRVGICLPLGLAYMAAVLEQHKYEVKVLDALVLGTGGWEKYGQDDQVRYGLSDAAIMWEIEQFEPDIVGISCPFSAREADTLNVCRIVKAIDPEIITVVGGAHPTCAPERFLKDPSVDRVVLGEGEEAILSIAECGMQGEECLRAEYIQNLDSLPFPARHLLPMDKYINSDSPHSGFKQKPFTNMITSRGCPNSCRFCCIKKIFGSKARFRSPESVLGEIKHLIDTYGIREVQFEDDNLLANRERAIKILQGIIDNGWDLALNSPSGLAVHTLDNEMLELMIRAGYYSVSIAVESGVQRVLGLMRKPVNLKKVPHVVRKIRELGMRAKAFFILGFPGETIDDMQRTVDYAVSLGLDWALFFRFTPIAGSEAMRMCREKGYLISTAMDPIRSFYQSVIRTPEFSPEDVDEMWEYANRRVNFAENTNIREGNYGQAAADFEAVLKHYPDLKIAKEALKKCQKRTC